MAVDAPNFIAGFNINSPAQSDPRAEGAGQIRGIKNALINTLPYLDGEVVIGPQQLSYLGRCLPILGELKMWAHLKEDKAPVGWAFCDGGTYNGIKVPDLRETFIMGANMTYDDARPIADGSTETIPGSEGGVNLDENIGDSIQAAAHKLTVEEMPPHSHTEKSRHEGQNITNAGSGAHASGGEYTTQTGSTGGKDGEAVGHIHAIENKILDPEAEVPEGEEPKRKPFDRRPKWFAFSYIMFVGFEDLANPGPFEVPTEE